MIQIRYIDFFDEELLYKTRYRNELIQKNSKNAKEVQKRKQRKLMSKIDRRCQDD